MMLVKFSKKPKSKNNDNETPLIIKKSKVRTRRGEPITILKISKSKSGQTHLHDLKMIGSQFKSGSQFKIAKRYDEKLIQNMEWVAVEKNAYWKCIRCGWCCTHSWRVNLTWEEYDRLKDKIPITEIVVDQKTGMSHPFFEIGDQCICYDPKDNICKIYRERAYSCATFPFAITHKGELVRSKFCNGFGHGNKINTEKMKKHIIKWRKKAGMRFK